jgi:hypothetical protein
VSDPAQEIQENAFWTSVLNLAFLAFAAVLLLPIGRGMLVLRMLGAYWLLWAVLGVLTLAIAVIIRRFRVDTDVPSNAYLLSNAFAAAVVTACWAAFAALLVGGAAAGAPWWVAAILYFVGLLSSWIAFSVVSWAYPGSLFRSVNLPVALLGFVLFAAWPAAARFMFGWFFRLF